MRKVVSLLAVLGLCVPVQANIVIDTVTVGNPGNAGEWAGQSYGGGGSNRICGAVGYAYNIGKFEVTAEQYTEFLNSVAKTDTYELYYTLMWSSNYGCKIYRGGSSGSYSYSVASDYANRPVNLVSWGDAARFANWLSNGQPTGGQGLTTTEDGSYYLNGATSSEDLLAVTRKSNATWVIPTEDEWYKAAYHKNDGVTGNYWNYPTSSDTMDTGTANYAMSVGHTTGFGTYGYPSPYGTFDQGGNVWEWNEDVFDGSYRGRRGGSFYDNVDGLHAAYRGHISPADSQGIDCGFRLALIPEPATFSLLVLGGLTILRRR